MDTGGEGGVYLVVHGQDDHQLPEDGNKVQEEFHAVPSHTNITCWCPVTGYSPTIL